MRYGSICSGIEAATVAWHGLGWEPAFFSEIDNFPRAALQHHYPNVPLHGDFTTINGDEYGHIDLLVGGTPCQDFSVAGLRAGLAGERGNLTLEFARLVDRMRPQWVVWENVPGVLSIDGGRAFGAFLGALAEIGYGFAYRILDAQYCGVPQRRRRVFVVGYLGDWRRAAAVLFERESLLRNPAPRREEGKGVTPILEAGARTGKSTTDLRAGSGIGEPGDPMFTLQAGKQHAIAPTIPARTKGGGGLGTDFDCDGGLVTHSLRAEGFDASEDGTGRGTPLVPVSFLSNASFAEHGEDICGTLRTDNLHAVAYPISADADRANSSALTPSPDAEGRVRLRDPGLGISAENDPMFTLQATKPPAVAFDLRGREGGAQFEGPHDTANIRAASGGSSRYYVAAMQVRRLTPMECERLQGFPDDYTLVPYRGKPAADGNRYKALGNSMAVPVMRWIGERIELIEALTKRIG